MNADQAVDHIRSITDKLPGSDVPWLQAIRSNALNVLSDQGFPHKKQEDWKYTNVKTIIEQEYFLQITSCVGLMPEDIQHLFLQADENYRIVFLNGRFAPQLSSIKQDDRIELKSLAKVISDSPETVQPYLAQYADVAAHGFNALNTASIYDGLYLHIHADVQLEEPIHVLYLTTASNTLMVLPRNLILLDDNARATVVEHYNCMGHANILVDVVGETRLARGAVLEHIKLQHESRETTHIATHAVVLQGSSQFKSHVISMGGKLVRSDTHVRLAEDHAQCALNGLYIATGRQHMDFHTFMEHVSADCSSRQDYRGVLDDHARVVFNGRVYVHQDAQHTDAHQSNNTLLLSRHAEMDTKPQLEIFADDVKCSHGATVGQLDEDMLFYLCSRGLSQETARGFLIKGFVSEVLGDIQHAAVYDRIQQLVDRQLDLEPMANTVTDKVSV